MILTVSRFSRCLTQIPRAQIGPVGLLVIVLGVATLSFTLGTYANDLSLKDVKRDENALAALLISDFRISDVVNSLQHDFKTNLGGHLAAAQQAGRQLLDELNAGHEWCLSVMEGPTTGESEK